MAEEVICRKCSTAMVPARNKNKAPCLRCPKCSGASTGFCSVDAPAAQPQLEPKTEVKRRTFGTLLHRSRS